tara:strand:+ start:195 stop:887 length:693 start_codon:yes stop_codon:yes gene_type:complete
MNSKKERHSNESSKLDIQAKKLTMGGFLVKESENEAYKKRMRQRKEIQEKRLEERNIKKGLIIVFTGNGKGKTTAALGIALRTLGHDENVAILQFIKGGWEPGEARSLQMFKEKLEWHSLGEGFTWETQDRERDKELVSKAWLKSLDYLLDKKYKLVVLDEILIAIKLGYLSPKEVLNGIKKRPLFTHVVLTGRNAPKEIIETADLVTEMKLLKHPFKEQGIKAQEGIEF